MTDNFKATRFVVEFTPEQILGIKNYNMSDGSTRPVLAVQIPVSDFLWKEVRVWPKARLGKGQELPNRPVSWLASYGIFVGDDGEVREGQPKYIGWRDQTGRVILLEGEEYTFQE